MSNFFFQFYHPFSILFAETYEYPLAIHLFISANKKVRQPKPTHRKRKLRLSPNKLKQNGDSNPDHNDLMEFAFLTNSKISMVKLRYNYPYKKIKYPLVSVYSVCLALLVYHNYLACFNSLIKRNKNRLFTDKRLCE